MTGPECAELRQRLELARSPAAEEKCAKAEDVLAQAKKLPPEMRAATIASGIAEAFGLQRYFDLVHKTLRDAVPPRMHRSQAPAPGVR
jgi:hypothetical protein